MMSTTDQPYWVTNADAVKCNIEAYLRNEDPSSVSYHNRCFAGMIEGGEATIEFFPQKRRASILAIINQAAGDQ